MSDTAGGPLQFMGPAVASLLSLLQVFPLCCQPLSMHVSVRVHHNLLLLLLVYLYLLHQVSFLLPVFPLSFPNLLAEVVHSVQSWMIYQRQEVSVPQLVIWC